MARERDVFSITEFARLSRTTRGTLLHYDKIGLLKPASRGEDNNYRFYTWPQLGAVNAIRTCRELGFSLSEVVGYINDRSPESVVAAMDTQIDKINDAIADWQRAQKLLLTLRGIVEGARGVDEGAITLARLPAERIVLGPENDYSHGRDVNDALLAFYRACRQKYPEMDLNYPVWGYYSPERIRNRDWRWPDNFYFYNPEGEEEKRGGLYATGYTRGGYGESDDAYNRILSYIEANGYEICGPAFEEYPLNEITVINPRDYLMRVSVAVQKKP